MKIIEDKQHLKTVNDIDAYFNDRDYFDCGQGFFQDEVEVYAKINNEYFIIKINATIESSKQDRGDRLYFVESIDNISYQLVSSQVIKSFRNSEIKVIITFHEREIKRLTIDLESELT